MNQVAETYAKLVLAVGQHDANYVDAYYGPTEWKTEAETTKKSLDQIRERAVLAKSALASETPATGTIEGLRHQFLDKQLGALTTRVEMLQGVVFSFDEESRALYDVVASHRPDDHYAEILDKLESLVPGTGPLVERYDQMRSAFMIPRDKLDAVFAAATEKAREVTKQYIPMPEGEDFRLEYVSGEVWGAYNWYKGNAHSLIQVNTDFPLPIDRAVGLACHEGYPGHHVYNALLETELARKRNWVEFTVYPLFSPQSLIAEGTAEYGIELTFSEEERTAFENDVLYPLAGLDPSVRQRYKAVQGLISSLGTTSNDAARRYLDGEVSREDTIQWLTKYSLATPARAEQRVRFIEANRSYVVTYNVGEELVRNYVESKGATREERWSVFTELLDRPQVPSNLG